MKNIERREVQEAQGFDDICILYREKNNISDEYALPHQEVIQWLNSEYKDLTKLTELEYEILKYCLRENYKYIARDKNGDISLYLDEPDKDLLTEFWHGKEYEFTLFNSLFPFIKWEDREATSIQEVLKNCAVENIKEEQ